MAYTVNFTDNTKTAITLSNGTVDTSTNIGLVGQGYTGYGEILAEDLLHIMEHFAGATAPSKPVEGQIWYDNANKVIKYFDDTVANGGTWKPIANMTVINVEPSGGGEQDGDFWLDPDTGNFYVYINSEWHLIATGNTTEVASANDLPLPILASTNIYTVGSAPYKTLAFTGVNEVLWTFSNYTIFDKVATVVSVTTDSVTIDASVTIPDITSAYDVIFQVKDSPLVGVARNVTAMSVNDDGTYTLSFSDALPELDTDMIIELWGSTTWLLESGFIVATPDVPHATTSQFGIVQYATDEEAAAGVMTDRAITPYQLIRYGRVVIIDGEVVVIGGDYGVPLDGEITPTGLVFINGTPISETFVSSNGVGTLVWSVLSGSLPDGISLDSSTGALTGTPTAAANTAYSFTILVQDENLNYNFQVYTGVIVGGVIAGSIEPTIYGVVRLVSFSITFISTGGTEPYTYSKSAGNFPAGLSLNGTTGVLSGTPTGAFGDAYNFTIESVDSLGNYMTREYSGTIDQIVGLVDPAHPTVVGTLNISNASLTSDGTNLWVGSWLGNQLYTINTDSPESMSIAATKTFNLGYRVFAVYSDSEDLISVSLMGNGGSSDTLNEAFFIVNKDDPLDVDRYSSSIDITGGDPTYSCVKGNYAYVIGTDAGTYFTVVNILDPSDISQVSIKNPWMRPFFIGRHDNNIYVTSWQTSGLSVWSVATSSDPTLITELPVTGVNGHVSGNGDYLAVVTSTGLTMVDVSVPSAPSIIGFDSRTNSNTKCLYVGDYVYATGDTHFEVWNVTNPSSPVFVKSISATGGRGIAIIDNTIFIGDTTSIKAIR